MIILTQEGKIVGMGDTQHFERAENKQQEYLTPFSDTLSKLNDEIKEIEIIKLGYDNDLFLKIESWDYWCYDGDSEYLLEKTTPDINFGKIFNFAAQISEVQVQQELVCAGHKYAIFFGEYGFGIRDSSSSYQPNGYIDENENKILFALDWGGDDGLFVDTGDTHILRVTCGKDHSVMLINENIGESFETKLLWSGKFGNDETTTYIEITEFEEKVAEHGKMTRIATSEVEYIGVLYEDSYLYFKQKSDSYMEYQSDQMVNKFIIATSMILLKTNESYILYSLACDEQCIQQTNGKFKKLDTSTLLNETESRGKAIQHIYPHKKHTYIVAEDQFTYAIGTRGRFLGLGESNMYTMDEDGEFQNFEWISSNHQLGKVKKRYVAWGKTPKALFGIDQTEPLFLDTLVNQTILRVLESRMGIMMLTTSGDWYGLGYHILYTGKASQPIKLEWQGPLKYKHIVDYAIGVEGSMGVFITSDGIGYAIGRSYTGRGEMPRNRVTTLVEPYVLNQDFTNGTFLKKVDGSHFFGVLDAEGQMYTWGDISGVCQYNKSMVPKLVVTNDVIYDFAMSSNVTYIRTANKLISCGWHEIKTIGRSNFETDILSYTGEVFPGMCLTEEVGMFSFGYKIYYAGDVSGRERAQNEMLLLDEIDVPKTINGSFAAIKPLCATGSYAVSQNSNSFGADYYNTKKVRFL
eukprot:CAMPEP_0117432490 /NCGR_PEP_ID=MMETSP0758-20121206/11965_1 /TAXON_ID=63605 /ORGANISM="Percolomonas cosmopolitus, Strain AE-1 (ATCC 50343)" /LENGTH=690 /DNA_ID=CAMNT_0005222433 /DNA_START=681 /DNA_END=2753 /DNA_ORIENTATION=-